MSRRAAAGRTWLLGAAVLLPALAAAPPALGLDLDGAVSLGREALAVALQVAGPLVLAGLAVGLVMGILQTMTSVQDATLAFVPKLLVVLAVLFVGLPGIVRVLRDFARHLLERLPQLVS